MVHVIADLLYVNLAQRFMKCATERREVRRPDVLFDLIRALRAGNHRGDGVEIQDPPEREIAERLAARYERAQPIDHGKPESVVDARKRFAAIPAFAVTIEQAVIVFFELRF